jgi:integrase
VRLLAVATPFLRLMIIAALDTGMRQGEMLALQFGEIDESRQLIVIRWETTKSKKTRVVPISTARLKAVLEWLRLDADDEKKPAEALIFSDEIGEPIGRFRTAWVTALLKAHGVKPAWKSYNWTALTPTCQQVFKRINLHWHDLRHEYASRLVERGVPVGPSARPPRSRVDHDAGALRQPETGEPAGRGAQARERQVVRRERHASHPRPHR